MVFKIAGESLDLIRLIGAFVIFASVLMFFHSASLMFESWTNIKMVNNCLLVANGETSFFEKCNNMSVSALNVSVRPDESALNGKQLYSALAPPIANMFFWIAMLLFGILLYNFRKFFIPLGAPVPLRSFARKGKK